jgi:long-subunit acyl-CoA synthetase (AMP-forming)
MSRVIDALRRHGAATPKKVALEDAQGAWAYGELPDLIEQLAASLRQSPAQVIAIHADNCVSWVLADLAAQLAGIPVVPLPLFFSPAQIAHVIRTAGIDQVLTDQPQWLSGAPQETPPASVAFHGGMRRVQLATGDIASTKLPAGTQKVTFTSGTTGEPSGVCLGRQEMEAVAESLRVASAARGDDRHLCLLPLGTLLENIGGIYTPLLAGATICVPPLVHVGMSGSSGLDVLRLVAALTEWRASSAIMVPQMLQALVAACQAGVAAPHTLRYLSVGGAPVARRLLQEAHTLGLPVHEGYGLSECASVVAVNPYGNNRSGSVGKPLPHLQLSFAHDGEILVRGVRWRGCVGKPAPAQAQEFIATGDLGYLDEDGFLYLTGRKKSIFITSFGRNIAPEWVERELVLHPAIAQAAVFGEARPFNSALIVARPSATPQAIRAALAQANEQLPDYARVRAWLPAAPFTPGNGMLTPNGRLRRANILAAYATHIDGLYQHLHQEKSHDLLPAS